MQQSNVYVIIFSAVLTVILGGLLAFSAIGLKPMQDMQVALDTQKKILGAVVQLNEGDDVPTIYQERIESLVVNAQGEVVNEVDGAPVVAEDIEVGKQFKLPVEERLFPVFKYHAGESDQVDAYILPVYGNGLWDNIWGYVALENDLETVKGIVFDHAGETPGLGARITSVDVQERFKGKKIYDDLGELVAIRMVKGETGDPSIYGNNEVDGLSGATITAVGVNDMLSNYLSYYEPYLEKVSDESLSKPGSERQYTDV
ncbi:NADH:ubiquinone reductase (Na(+)-transporting) subunit C [Tunicatimonas pelagia]|uniref:NADH:ubiquinone reductase (Na(+)-transporting) subunit C n=1 Tax=Tunicatimonas pelagia TaxID=931531 RepID=UPI002665C8A2|nr:NADH:ubiquinone reductase (Na(+)-transporting) subunit C [Tunicatimonas pelagia]WKN43732.1 NADH:ubiquinone reductase (Na(+)-transporting) subunit C [Tunicatimonas pelagia]